MRAKRISPHVRVLAIDDAPFARKHRARVRVIGVLSRGAHHVENVYSTSVVRDGWGATRAIADMVRANRLSEQAQFVLLDGIAVGGFNVIDVSLLSASIALPVITVMRKKPDLVAMARALAHVSRPSKRLEVISRAGAIHCIEVPALWFQCIGCETDEAEGVLATLCTEGNYPEPLRLAHLIGAALQLGRSRGGA